jgi:hypothetical protein
MHIPKVILVVSALAFAGIHAAAQQQQAPPPVQQPAPQAASQPAPQAAPANTPAGSPNDGKVRIYVADSQSWEMSGGWGASNGTGGGHESGGARPQTAEIIKTFNQRCPEYTITNNKDKANYAAILDHEGGKGLVRRRNTIAVFNREGDAIFSDSTRELGNSVEDACSAITKDLAGLKK